MSGNRNGPRFDVVASTRRQFIREQKRAIIAEVEGGATVSEVARRHNIHTGLLFRWRRAFSGALSAPGAAMKAEPKAGTFLPVRVAGPAPSTEPRSEPSRGAAMIEIELVTGRKLRLLDQLEMQLGELVATVSEGKVAAALERPVLETEHGRRPAALELDRSAHWHLDPLTPRSSPDGYRGGASSALDAALDAMDEWQAELVELTERVHLNCPLNHVTHHLCLGLGGLKELILAGWRSNLKSSNGPTIEPTTNTIGHALTAPPVDLVQFATVLPQFWIQTMGTWQKNWSDAMGRWMGPSENAKHLDRRKGESG